MSKILLFFLLLTLPYLFPYYALADRNAANLNEVEQEYNDMARLQNRRADYESKLLTQARNYRFNTLWEKYYWSAPGFGSTVKARTRMYYQAAFVEAEKYFAAHTRESGIENRVNREDLFSLCNSMLDPYFNTGIAGGLSNTELNQALMRKRIWKIYENAFKPNFQAIKQAQFNYENYKLTHKIP